MSVCLFFIDLNNSFRYVFPIYLIKVGPFGTEIDHSMETKLINYIDINIDVWI